MARIFTTEISESQCIGDSLDTINTNYLELDEECQRLRTSTTAISTTLSAFNITDSTTVDLTWINSTRTLSADVKDNSITSSKIASNSVRYSQLAAWQSLSATPTLSAEAVQPRLAKAWGSVNIYGTVTLATLSAYNYFNVFSVTDTSTRTKSVQFVTPMNSNKYVVYLTAMCSSGETGYITIEPMVEENQTTTGFVINHYDETARSYTRVNFIVFDY